MTNTLTLEGLQAKLKSLGLESFVPKYANSQVLQNPIDIYRSYLADILTPLIGVGSQLIYDSLQWTNSLNHGDLVLVVPKLRLKGVKPADYALNLESKVCACVHSSRLYCLVSSSK